MNAPELRFRHSAPIAKHVAGKSSDSRTDRTKSNRNHSWIASSPHSDGTSERLFHKSRIKWTLLGFVLGVVFWHVVGFWGFIGDIMLKGHSNSSTLMTRIQQTQQSASDTKNDAMRHTNVVKRELSVSRDALARAAIACTQLVMDRRERKTYSASCVDQQPNSVTAPKLVQTASSNSRLDE